ncbi:tail fiber domain-containing protein [Pseudoalteromonas sp. ASV78]|uniref:tail fiber domain-containing protein n=1 Tax=Pseudoalteromonas sp. ASV78 TaxID=3397851 RepID=UPI0039FD9AAA
MNSNQASTLNSLSVEQGSLQARMLTQETASTDAVESLRLLGIKDGELSSQISTVETATIENAQRVSDLATTTGTLTSRITSVESVNSNQASTLNSLSVEQGSLQARMLTQETASTDAVESLRLLGIKDGELSSQISTVETATIENAQRVSDLATTTGTLTSRITSVESVNSNQASTLNSLSVEQGSLQARMLTQETASTDAVESLRLLGIKDGELSSQISTVETATIENAQRVSDLTTTAGNLTSRITSVEQTTASSSQKIAQLETVQGDNSSKITNLQQTTASSAQEITQLKATDAAVTADISSIKSVNNTQAQQLNSISTQQDTHQSQISVLQTTTANQASVSESLTYSNNNAGDKVVCVRAADFTDATSGEHAPVSTRVFDTDEGVEARATNIWVYSRKAIKVRTDRVYKVRFKVKQLVNGDNGVSRVYAGVVPLRENMSIAPMQSGGAGTHLYCAVSSYSLTVSQGWKTFEGTISGIGLGANNFRPDTVYVRPMLIVNYQSSGSPVALIDSLELWDVTEEQALDGKIDVRYDELKQVSDTSVSHLQSLQLSTDTNRTLVTTQKQVTDSHATLISTLQSVQGANSAQIVTLQNTTSTHSQTLQQLAVSIDNKTAAVETSAKAYADDLTGALKAEKVIKVDANGVVAGFGVLADSNTGSTIYLSADKVAIVPPNWNPSETSKRLLPFVYSAEYGRVVMDKASIVDLTADKITGGNLIVDNFTTTQGFQVAPGSIKRWMLEADFKDGLVRIDPTAEKLGGGSIVSVKYKDYTRQAFTAIVKSGGQRVPVAYHFMSPKIKHPGKITIRVSLWISEYDSNYTRLWIKQAKLNSDKSITLVHQPNQTDVITLDSASDGAGHQQFSYDDDYHWDGATEGMLYRTLIQIETILISGEIGNLLDDLVWGVSTDEPVRSSGGVIADIHWRNIVGAPLLAEKNKANVFTADQIVPNLHLNSGGKVFSKHNNSYILGDHGNGNVTVNAAGGTLHVGHVNTTRVDFNSPVKLAFDTIHNGVFRSSTSGTTFHTPSGYIQLGPLNTSYAHIYTDRPSFYFNKELFVNAHKVWHAGNDEPLGKLANYQRWTGVNRFSNTISLEGSGTSSARGFYFEGASGERQLGIGMHWNAVSGDITNFYVGDGDAPWANTYLRHNGTSLLVGNGVGHAGGVVWHSENDEPLALKSRTNIFTAVNEFNAKAVFDGETEFDTSKGFILKRMAGASAGDDIVTLKVEDSSFDVTIDNQTDMQGANYRFMRKLSTGANQIMMQFSPGNIEYMGGKVWHENNDGVDSGLDADLWQGMKPQAILPLQSQRDFTLGTLVKTDINYAVTNGVPWYMEITGNSYGGSRPFNTQLQGYIYSNTMLNCKGTHHGHPITGMTLFEFEGKLCFWWPTQSYWQGFTITVKTSHIGEIVNQVTAIQNAHKPTAITKNVALDNLIAMGWNSFNDGTGSGLDADNVRGIAGDKFARLDIDNTFDGQQVIDRNLTMGLSDFSKASLLIKSPTFQLGFDSNEILHSGDNLNIKTLTKSVRIFAPSDVDGLQFNDHKVYHAGNDGINSGLDADLFRGQDDAFYLAGAMQEAVTITVAGDADKFYPVLLPATSKHHFAKMNYHIGRSYNGTAPATWNNATHKGGLSFDFSWSGTGTWGGNDRNITVHNFDETYSRMVGGLLNTHDGVIVWLRGGTAIYKLTTPLGVNQPYEVHLVDFVSRGGTVCPVRGLSDIDAKVTSEVLSKSILRNNAQLWDSGQRVYSDNNKPTLAQIDVLDDVHAWTGDNTFQGSILGLGAGTALVSNSHTVLNGTDSWLRTKNNDGWFNATHGGGIHMQDSTWVRVYGGKGFLVDNTANNAIYSAGGVLAKGGFFDYHESGEGGLVGSYSLPGRATQPQMIWTIGTSFTTHANHYGLGYRYEPINGVVTGNEHTIVGVQNGAVNYRLGLNGNAWFKGGLNAQTLYENGINIADKYLSVAGLSYNTPASFALAFKRVDEFNQAITSGELDTSAYSTITPSIITGFVNSVMGHFNTVIADSTNTRYLTARSIEVTGRRALVNNASASGHVDGWFSTASSNTSGEATALTLSSVSDLLSIDGANVTTIREVTNGNRCYSHAPTEVDHNAIYELSVTLYAGGATLAGTRYFGIVARGGANLGLSIHNVQAYDAATRSQGNNTSNPYFYANSSDWGVPVTVKGYVVGANRSVDEVPETDNPIFKLTTATTHLWMRILNWANNGTETVLHIYNPSMREVNTGKIVTHNLVADIITADKIAANAVQASHIQAASVNASHIQAGVIGTNHLAANSIESGHIKSGTIQASDIASNTITALQISANAITASELSANAVNADHILANNILAKHIKVDQVNATHIAAGSILAEHITTNLIDSAHIKAGAIDAVHISVNTIGADKILANAILATHIGVDVINAGHISAGSIKSEHVESNAIKANHITANVITSAHVAANTLTADEIATDAIETRHLKAFSINAEHINSATFETRHFKSRIIEANHIKVTALNQVNNFSLTGEMEGWSGYSGNLELISRDSETVQALGIETSGDMQVTGDYFEVDPDSIYEFSITIHSKHADATGTRYFGLNAQGYDGGSLGLRRFHYSGTRELSSGNDGNPYFWSGECFNGQWLTITGYVVGANRSVSEVPARAEGNPAGNIFQMLHGTKKLRMRFLNYYNNGVSVKNWFYSPSVKRVGGGLIDTPNLIAGAVVAEKIAANAINAGHIQAASIDTAHLKAGMITAEKIAAGAITVDKLAANSVSAVKIAANSIDATKIAAGAITADKIAVNAINSSHIDTSTINVESLSWGNNSFSTRTVTDGNSLFSTGFYVEGNASGPYDRTVMTLNTLAHAGIGLHIDSSNAVSSDWGAGLRIKSANVPCIVAYNQNAHAAVFSTSNANSAAVRIMNEVGSNRTWGGALSIDGDVIIEGVTKWAIAGTAHQRVDPRPDGSSVEARMHWYGVNQTGGTARARHSFYDGSTYLQWDAYDGGFHTDGYVQANGGLRQDGHIILNGGDTWLRTKNNDGIFFSSHGGGFHMEDSTWVRVYGGRRLYVPNTTAESIKSEGGIRCTEGRFSGTVWFYYSDQRLKTIQSRIDPLEALDNVNRWTAAFYKGNEVAEKYGFDCDELQIGLMAQEIEKDYPQLTTIAPFDSDENGKSISGQNFKTLQYERTTAVLTAALQGETIRRKQLENKVFKMEKMMKEILARL